MVHQWPHGGHALPDGLIGFREVDHQGRARDTGHTAGHGGIHGSAGQTREPEGLGDTGDRLVQNGTGGLGSLIPWSDTDTTDGEYQIGTTDHGSFNGLTDLRLPGRNLNHRINGETGFHQQFGDHTAFLLCNLTRVITDQYNKGPTEG